MKIKGVIFDVDGTLLDSMFLWDTVGSEYLRSLGIEPREGLNEIFRSMSLYQAACYYQKEYGVTLLVEEIMDGVNAMIEDYYRYEVQLKEGTAEFLEFLYRNGVKMCVATATDRHLVEAALERLKIPHYISEIFTCTSVGHGKDEPVIFERALSFLQTLKSETLVFEDALYAVKTAKSAGFTVVAVYDKYQGNQKEVRASADWYIHNFYQAREVLFQ